MRHNISVLCFPAVGLLALLNTHSKAQPESIVEDPYSWSKPVNGLRARLVPVKPTFRKDEEFRFLLQFHNATDKRLRMNLPTIMPMIAPPNNHPFVGNRFDCVLTTNPVNGAVSILWGARETLLRKREICTLPPNGVLQFDIRCPKVRREKKKDTLETVKDKPLGVERLDMQFALRDVGKYEVAGVYEYPRKRKPGAAIIVRDRRLWTGRIVLPKVVVEIVK